MKGKRKRNMTTVECKINRKKNMCARINRIQTAAENPNQARHQPSRRSNGIKKRR